MSSSGEAAEQVVRIGLEGTEMALKLSGTGAKHLAVLLYSILSEKNKTAGKTRVVNMLRSGKELKIFTIKEEDLKKFSQEARRYGVLYCALREKKPAEGSEVEVMVKEDDAARVNRIVDKLKLASVDIGKAVADVEKTKDEAAHGEQDKGVEGKNAAAREAEEAARKPAKRQQPTPENPTPAKTEKSRRSGSTSDARGTSTRGGGGESSRKSVKKEMEGIRKEQQRRAERQRERERADARDAERRGREPIRGSKEKDEEGRPR